MISDTWQSRSWADLSLRRSGGVLPQVSIGNQGTVQESTLVNLCMIKCIDPGLYEKKNRGVELKICFLCLTPAKKALTPLCDSCQTNAEKHPQRMVSTFMSQPTHLWAIHNGGLTGVPIGVPVIYLTLQGRDVPQAK